jgi:hypothetical protein
MSDSDWQKRFKEWISKAGLPEDASGLDVFRKMVEIREQNDRTLVHDLEERFNTIAVILQETGAERKNQ